MITQPGELIEALGGSTAVAGLLTKRIKFNSYSTAGVHYWKTAGAIPDLKTFHILTEEAQKIGVIAHPIIWGLGQIDCEWIAGLAAGMGRFFRPVAEAAA